MNPREHQGVGLRGSRHRNPWSDDRLQPDLVEDRCEAFASTHAIVPVRPFAKFLMDNLISLLSTKFAQDHRYTGPHRHAIFPIARAAE